MKPVVSAALYLITETTDQIQLNKHLDPSGRVFFMCARVWVCVLTDA